MVKKIFLIGLPLVILVSLVAFFAIDGSANKEDVVKTVAVERGTIIDKALAVGKIDPEREIAVKSKVAGIVRTTFVDVGDKVKMGDPLFDIKPDPTPIEYANAKRSMELKGVAFDKVKREYDRAVQLRDKKLISNQEFEVSLSNYEDAELRLKLAEEKLALIESGSTNVADRRVDNIIKAPIDGTVLTLEVEVGDPIVPLTTYQAGTELMRLAEMSELVFKGTVDEIDVGKLTENMAAEVEIGALPNQKLSGILERISPKAVLRDGATLFDVEITLDNDALTMLRAGYSANADIIISKAESVLVVPERLVTVTDSSSSVEIQDSLGVITTKEITTGLSDGITIEIVSGLSEGELVVERPPREIKAN